MPTQALDALIRMLEMIPRWPAITYPMATFILVGIGILIRKYLPPRKK